MAVMAPVLILRRPVHDGEQRVYACANRYGASVIQHRYSYGGERGLYELAVVRFYGDADDYDLCYHSPVTSDVEGYLTEADVQRLLVAIEDLPPATCRHPVEPWPPMPAP